MVVLTFDFYKSLRIYMQNYEETNMTQITLDELGFNSVNPPIKVKILSNGAIDIVNTNGQFISNIKLSPQQKNYIANINTKKCERQFIYIKTPPALLFDNYEEEQFWALTSKMRNYTVGFKFACECKVIRDWLAKRLIKPRVYSYVSGEEYSSEYHDEDQESDELSSLSSDLVDDSDEDMDNLDTDNSVNQFHEVFDDDECIVANETAEMLFDDVEGGGKIVHSEVVVPIKIMFNKVLSVFPDRAPNCIVFEYFFDKCNYCTVKKIHPEVMLLEMFVKDPLINDGSESTTLVHVLTAILFGDVNCDGVHKRMHGYGAAYWSGVNFYTDAEGATKGVIFGGHQMEDSYDYGSTMNDDCIVPDLLLTNEAIVNMNNYTIPQTCNEENFWYDYEAYKEAGKYT